MNITHIKTLKFHLNHWKHLNAEHICEEKEGRETIEALQAAIEALQTQLKKSPENFNKPSETESMLNADLISRRAAKNAICKEWCGCDAKHCPHSSDETYYCDGCDDARIIDKLPSVMPTQIIQCKDCKHLYQDGECPLRLWKTHVEDDFCSYAEAKMEDDGKEQE